MLFRVYRWSWWWVSPFWSSVSPICRWWGAYLSLPSECSLHAWPSDCSDNAMFCIVFVATVSSTSLLMAAPARVRFPRLRWPRGLVVWGSRSVNGALSSTTLVRETASLMLLKCCSCCYCCFIIVVADLLLIWFRKVIVLHLNNLSWRMIPSSSSGSSWVLLPPATVSTLPTSVNLLPWYFKSGLVSGVVWNSQWVPCCVQQRTGLGHSCLECSQ